MVSRSLSASCAHSRCIVTDSDSLADRIAARLHDAPDEPVSHLIVDEVWLAVVEGTIGSGARLPTSRQLAVRLGVSPRSVERAYEELAARGVVATRAGEGTFISLRPPSSEERERHARFAALCRETFERSVALGFTVDDLIDALAEFRASTRVGREEE